jgi:Domain of unknown function (DUF2715)
MKTLFLISIVCFLFTGHLSAQDTIVKHKPSVFIYSEKDAPLAMDIGGGVGADNIGLRTGLGIHLDVYHILAGFNYIISLRGSKEMVTEKSLLFGYRYRTQHLMVTMASGFGWQQFKCTSGMNSDCYNYIEQTIKATPLNFQADWIITDAFAIGISLNQMFSSRKDVTGLMFNVKFGAFRNLY